MSKPHNFVNVELVRRELSAWIRWCNEERPQKALAYRRPTRIPGAGSDSRGLMWWAHYTELLKSLAGGSR